ncbi:MAG TPA: hypothetical protein VFU02_03750 [Polyangiaceae bacterium]|nr:hypothetical protein [Polyangiaceae bacterium]
MSKPPDPAPLPTPPVADSDEEAATPATKTKKTAKRRRTRRGATPEADRELDANGRERPRFLLAFPDHPELAKLSRAFEAGNYAYVREHASEVAARAEDDEVRRAALELAERIKPDPLIKYLLVLSIALLAYLVIHAYGSHGP